MDKNTIAGLVIIFLILIGFSYLTRPSTVSYTHLTLPTIA